MACLEASALEARSADDSAAHRSAARYPVRGSGVDLHRQSAAGEPPRVFEDGFQRRNFIHVSDVAAAVVTALHAPLPARLTALNIGTPWVTTVGEMATELSRILDGPAPMVTGAYRLGDVRHITADCSAAEHVLGWRARIDLRTGLADLSPSMAARAAADADKSG